MMKKWLTVGIVLLFAGTCIIPAMAQTTEKSQSTSRGNWLYVGGSGPGNYTTIRSAINNASEGDTIFVYSGTYYEGELGISKLNLLGEDRNTTIIDGSYIFSYHQNVIHTGSDSKIHGFTITRDRKGDGICITGDNVTISNNIITNASPGIDALYYPFPFLTFDHQIEIYNNVFLNNHYYGIVVQYSGFSIHDNSFVSNKVGIFGSAIGKTSIVHNHFEDNDIGIQTDHLRATIRHNNFINNEIHAEIQNGYVMLPHILLLMFVCHTFWINNYWDDWEQRNPRPIPGTSSFYTWPKLVQVFSMSIVQFDWLPAKHPYNISGMT